MIEIQRFQGKYELSIVITLEDYWTYQNTIVLVKSWRKSVSNLVAYYQGIL